jgi:aminoglycoside/choline kinase family phosphotransferase
MTVDPEIVDDPAAVTAEWLTAVLRHAGHDVTVASFASEPVGTGQMAHNERYTLTYAGEAGDAPASVVMKFPATSEESRAAGAQGGYRAEVRFYTDLAERLAIRVPRCLYGAVTDDSTSFTLVLEDLAPARQGDQIAGAPAHHIEAAARNLAGLHAPLWDSPELDEIEFLNHSAELAVGYVELVTPMFVERYADRLDADAVRVLEGFAAGAARWLETETGPRSLVHGDYRLDNLLFGTDEGGDPVAAVDWQTLAVAGPGRDLAYLLGNSCEPDDRRACEHAVVEAYRRELARLGVERSSEQVWADVRHGSFQGPFITMLGSIATGRTDRGDTMFMAMTHRSVAQILDHDTLELLA